MKGGKVSKEINLFPDEGHVMKVLLRHTLTDQQSFVRTTMTTSAQTFPQRTAAL